MINIMDCAHCGTAFSYYCTEGDKPDFDYTGWLIREEDDKTLLWNYTEVACKHGCCTDIVCVGCNVRVDTKPSYIVRYDELDRCSCHPDGPREDRCDWWDATETQIEALMHKPGELLREGVRTQAGES